MLMASTVATLGSQFRFHSIFLTSARGLALADLESRHCDEGSNLPLRSRIMYSRLLRHSPLHKARILAKTFRLWHCVMEKSYSSFIVIATKACPASTGSNLPLRSDSPLRKKILTRLPFFKTKQSVLPGFNVFP